jgi:hypothetical protein
MNPKMLALALSSLLFGTLTTQSQTDPFATNEVANEAPRMIRVQAEFIEMPHATFTRLMAKPRTSANDTDLRAECAKLIENGEAQIIESLNVTALPGQSATTENIHEFIYPTEYSPPGPMVPLTETEFPQTPPGSPPIWSAFDTKNTGSTFEVEAQIDANLPIVELRFTPTLVHHTGQDVWGIWERNGVKVETSMPRFYILSVKAGATVAAGQPHMVAGLSPRSEDGWMDSTRKVMTFIRADIITIGK